MMKAPVNILLVILLIVPTISLAVDREEIRAKLREHLKDVKACYDASLSLNPELNGKIVIDWKVDDTGTVTKISVNSPKTTLKDTGVQSCVLEKLKAIVFPPAPKGGDVTISYPFIFSKN